MNKYIKNLIIIVLNLWEIGLVREQLFKKRSSNYKKTSIFLSRLPALITYKSFKISRPSGAPFSHQSIYLPKVKKLVIRRWKIIAIGNHKETPNLDLKFQWMSILWKRRKIRRILNESVERDYGNKVIIYI